ncbi:hypothetical protein OCU04_000936 [Sclerotinia nivalis]|uniref:Heterokaryon incompatibility domain-containing protein n=1 Tax=Sclerotinia nivalis TaxID=352851 RepID=A0A9X0DQQ3_9HELO|nr:hypothetical protein OCU04_000936 [Sclerotinia nivalis]
MAGGNLENESFSKTSSDHEITSLCKLCDSIIFYNTHIGVPTVGVPIQDLPDEEIPTMLAILNGTQGGCRLCAVAWGVFQNWGDGRYFSVSNHIDMMSLTEIAQRYIISSLFVERSTYIVPGYYKLSCKTNGGDLEQEVGIDFILALDVVNGYHDFHKTSHLSTSTVKLSEERWKNFCCSSIATCQNTHELCNSESESDDSSGRLPTRLIDLKSDPPRLILSSKLPLGSLYATLSHCWGKTPILTLTTKNLEVFQQQLPVSQLGQTLKDAIDIGKRLFRDFNVQYLWIDSLCIMQDSKTDWLNEAPQMAHIYGNAFCCIAASSASDGSKGLFSSRNSTVDEVLFLRHDRLNHPQLPSPVMITVLDRTKWHQIIKEAPLNQRGWVVQERILSKRTLQFFKGEVFWKCQQSMASETFSVIAPSLQIHDDHLIFPPSLVTNFNFRSFWHQLLQTYGKTVLSYPEDILIAIAGVSRHFQKYLPTTNKLYLAGMWFFELERQLGWSATRHGFGSDLDHRECPSKYVAPSWSWASSTGRSIGARWTMGVDCDASIKWYEWTKADYQRHMVLDMNRIQPPSFTIIEAETKVLGEDPFGPVTSGFLRLRGQLKIGRHSFTATKKHTMTRTKYRNGHFLEVLGTSSGSGSISSMSFDRLHSDEELKEIRSGVLFLFPLVFQNLRDARALILKPSGTRKKLVRIGCLFSITNKFAMDFDSETDALIGDDIYEESHGNGEYTICII